MSEVVLPAPVKASVCTDIDEVEGVAGAFEFYADGSSDGRKAGMIYCCPCGCGQKGSLAFRPRPSPSWEWNGETERITLSPSVHHVGHWHGYLRDGYWVQA